VSSQLTGRAPFARPRTALASRVTNAVPLRVAEQAHHNRVYLVTPVLPTPGIASVAVLLPTRWLRGLGRQRAVHTEPRRAAPDTPSSAKMDSRAASTGTRSNPAPDPSITARLKLVTSRTPFPCAGLDPRVNDARLHTTKIGRPDLPR
jgi:hypothetical protein